MFVNVEFMNIFVFFDFRYVWCWVLTVFNKKNIVL